MLDFEIGYKVEVMAGDSPLRDVIQPLLTLRYKDFYKEYYSLGDLFEDFEALSKAFEGEGIYDLRISPLADYKFCGLARLDNPSYEKTEKIEFSNVLANYPAIYDENDNLKNADLIQKLERRLKKCIITIYKNIFPMEGDSFHFLLSSKPSIVLLIHDEKYSIYKEFELEGHPDSYPINFLDALDALKIFFQLKSLPEELERFVSVIKSKIKKLEEK